MKIAFCLHGLAGGKNDRGVPVDSGVAHSFYKKHALDKNDADVFIHTWSIDSEDRINGLYGPKKSLFEKQIMFDESPSKKHSTYSRWYSLKKAVELKKEYEKERGFVYDCVMIARFDMLFFKDLDFSKFDMKYFYVPGWDGDASLGVSDVWFFSNSKNMDRFASLYDRLDDYLEKEKLELSSHVLARRHLEYLDLLGLVKPIFVQNKDFMFVRDWKPSFKKRFKKILRKLI